MGPTSARERRLWGGGLGLSLVLALVAPGPLVGGDDPPDPVKLIHQNGRAFRIPFNIEPSQASRIKEVRLCVSPDQGQTWTPMSPTTPDMPSIAFRAPRDGEYWFAVQTRDNEGQLYPPRTAEIEPKLKVVVDTLPPELTLESNGRRGELASVRWEIRDQRLDRASFVLEYQPQGARDWRQVPVDRPTPLIGEATWNAGTAEPIRVRASVSDRARNTTEKALLLGDGTPQNPNLPRDAASEASEPPPLGNFTSGSGEVGSLPRMPGPPRDDPPPSRTPRGPATASEPPRYNPFDVGPRPADSGSPAAESGTRPQLIRSPRFNLNYEVADAGPAGPARVELWVTQDDGRTWSLRGTDPDRKSPFPVDLGGEGTFGLTLVAKSASDLGDPSPGPGDRPQYFVEVDATPPTVQLEPVQPLTGVNAGKVAIVWHAKDLHLGPAPVKILVRPEGSQDWRPIVQSLENSGRYDWSIPPNAPARFHVRVEVADTAGNVGSDETQENAPVMVDRTAPRARSSASSRPP